VQDSALVGDLALLLRELVDLPLEVVVRQRSEIRQRFQEDALSLEDAERTVNQQADKGSTCT
jgi:hypothetical protein